MKLRSKGTCILAGAGPGDIGLVTLRTKEAVEQAEVIVYDYLCNSEILKWAPPDAELVYVGKKSGHHTLRQEEINQFLIDKTNEGKRVVRLKGGDPFVFGRGGEEAEALAAAGLAFEIVPGVSSAIAVPAYAGIPLTYRDVASSFTVFTGHEDPTKEASAIDFKALVAGKGTLVMLMGMERLDAIVSQLLASGADLHLPVGVGDGAVLLRPGRGRQYDIGVFRGLGQEDVLDDEVFELGERLARMLDIGVRHRRVLAHDVHAPDLVAVHRVHDLDDGQPALVVERGVP